MSIVKEHESDNATRGMADMILSDFDRTTKIPKKQWPYSPTLPYYYEVMDYLLSEQYIKETPYNFEITYKGRLKIDDGGFVGAFNRERNALWWCRFAAIVSAIAAVASLIALTIALIDFFSRT